MFGNWNGLPHHVTSTPYAYVLQQCKNFENQLRFDKLETVQRWDIGGTFFGDTVYFYAIVCHTLLHSYAAKSPLVTLSSPRTLVDTFFTTTFFTTVRYRTPL